MFPSTTSAHTTCIHTGLSVAKSGVFEWYYYDPVVDDIISPLLYSLAGEKQREQLATLDFKPADLFPEPTLYQDLQGAGVKSYILNNHEYARSNFSVHVTRGADIVDFYTWPEALTNLLIMLDREPGKSYYFLYASSIDTILHRYGPDTAQFEAEMLSWLDQMQRFLQQLARRPRRTLLLLGADHGQVEISPQSTTYINLRLPQLAHWLRINRSGKPLRFGGSPRDLFLYVKDEYLEEAQSALDALLEGKALVIPTTTLIADGIFGPDLISARLAERLGNLVLLPRRYEAVFWHEANRFEQKYYGHHGGLTPEEMFTPLIAYPV